MQSSYFSTTFKPFIPSFRPCDSVSLGLNTRMTPFRLNRSFTRCCGINDWLTLRKTKGKTRALLVLQCRRLGGVQSYSNHSAEVSRAHSGMFRDSSPSFIYSLSMAHSVLWRLNSCTAFTQGYEVRKCHDVVTLEAKSLHWCSYNFWGFALRKSVVAHFAAGLYEREKAGGMEDRAKCVM